MQQTIGAKLQEDPSITHVVTLDAGIATAAVQAQDGAGTQVGIATFDLSPEVVQAIQAGDVEFSFDQQPYVQGYLAVHSLWLQLTNGNDVGGGQPMLTGPSFVDASNIDAIATFAAGAERRARLLGARRDRDLRRKQHPLRGRVGAARPPGGPDPAAAPDDRPPPPSAPVLRREGPT